MLLGLVNISAYTYAMYLLTRKISMLNYMWFSRIYVRTEKKRKEEKEQKEKNENKKRKKTLYAYMCVNMTERIEIISK